MIDVHRMGTKMNRRDRQVLGRRTEIMSAALRLFETKGYLETSMEEIAETADVARGTLYNHFESKADVLLALTDTVAQEWHAKAKTNLAAGVSPRIVICDVLHSAALWMDEHPKSARAFFYAMREQMVRRGALPPPKTLLPPELVIAAQEAHELTKDFEADLLVHFIESVMRHNLMTKVLGDENKPVAAKILKEVELVLDRLAPI